MARLTQADLSDLNESFEERTPSELIHWPRNVWNAPGGVIFNAESRLRGWPYDESDESRYPHSVC